MSKLESFCTPTKGTRGPTEKQNANSEVEHEREQIELRKSSRKPSPTKKYQKYSSELKNKLNKSPNKSISPEMTTDDDQDDSDISHEIIVKPTKHDVLFHSDCDVPGRNLFGFHTPSKKGAMALTAQNSKQLLTPKNKTTDAKRNAVLPKTPSHVRTRVKKQISKITHADSDTDFSVDGSDFDPDSEESSSSSDCSEDDEASKSTQNKLEKSRQPIKIPTFSKTATDGNNLQSARRREIKDFVPESDGYFVSHAAGKSLTSNHTLDRLKNPRLPADQVFSLLADMKINAEHETAINSLMTEYKTYFPKWMFILNEGFSILLYGLGSKRELLHSFHQDMLGNDNALIVNGFFPSLTLKDILDSIYEILEAGPSPANPNEAADMIQDKLSSIPNCHIYLIIHNIDGPMLRNSRAQTILSQLAKVPNIHLLASIDHINAPLLWDQSKLCNYNFSWWDCTTMLPYTAETAFETSLMVQNSGELALSSMRNVFSSLTTNTKGIYLIIVKYQLKNKGNLNYQGMSFKDLYWSCREAFLVSSDLALRAQLTEFLDHKMIKSKRSVDGSEQLTIPIESSLLQQFLEEQEKN